MISKIALALLATLAISACGDDNDSAGDVYSGTSGPQGASCTDLAGSRFLGADDNSNTPEPPPEGCEGCGQTGWVEFSSATEASYLAPDDDQEQSCTYTVNDNQLSLDCDLTDQTMTFNGDCTQLSAGGEVYTRQ